MAWHKCGQIEADCAWPGQSLRGAFQKSSTGIFAIDGDDGGLSLMAAASAKIAVCSVVEQLLK